MNTRANKSNRLYAFIIAVIAIASVYIGRSFFTSKNGDSESRITNKQTETSDIQEPTLTNSSNRGIAPPEALTKIDSQSEINSTRSMGNATNGVLSQLREPTPQLRSHDEDNLASNRTEIIERALSKPRDKIIRKSEREHVLTQVLDILTSQLGENIAELEKEIADSDRPIEDIAPRMARRGARNRDFDSASAADVIVLKQNAVTKDRDRLGIIARLARNLAPMDTSSITFHSQNGMAHFVPHWRSASAPNKEKQKQSLLLHLLVARQLDHRDLASNALECSAWLKASLGSIRAAAELFEERSCITMNQSERKKSIRQAVELYQRAGDLEAARGVLQRVLEAEEALSLHEKVAAQAEVARISFRESVLNQGDTSIIIDMIDQSEGSHGISQLVALNIALDVIRGRSDFEQVLAINLWALVESHLDPIAKAAAAESAAQAVRRLDPSQLADELSSAIAAVISIGSELENTQWHIPNGIVLADLYEFAGDYEEADLVRRRYLDQITPSNPLIITIQEARIRSLIAQDRVSDAKAVLEDLLTAWPGYEPQGTLRDLMEGKVE